jgi:hypothetical protein
MDPKWISTKNTRVQFIVTDIGTAIWIFAKWRRLANAGTWGFGNYVGQGISGDELS